jgi:hypothetical protein
LIINVYLIATTSNYFQVSPACFELTPPLAVLKTDSLTLLGYSYLTLCHYTASSSKPLSLSNSPAAISQTLIVANSDSSPADVTVAQFLSLSNSDTYAAFTLRHATL